MDTHSFDMLRQDSSLRSSRNRWWGWLWPSLWTWTWTVDIDMVGLSSLRRPSIVVLSSPVSLSSPLSSPRHISGLLVLPPRLVFHPMVSGLPSLPHSLSPVHYPLVNMLHVDEPSSSTFVVHGWSSTPGVVSCTQVMAAGTTTLLSCRLGAMMLHAVAAHEWCLTALYAGVAAWCHGGWIVVGGHCQWWFCETSVPLSSLGYYQT
ncbi:hypothetical protein PAXINDRAFT_165657 [Paxillus involutus ATCC 200175]|nr:hypothetical protein PAXINDRAFT_165657 [Paxillus involutus ATCC 200175]